MNINNGRGVHEYKLISTWTEETKKRGNTGEDDQQFMVMGCHVIYGLLLLLAMVLEGFKAHAKCSHYASLLPAVSFVIKGAVFLHTSYDSQLVILERSNDSHTKLIHPGKHLIIRSYLSDEAALMIWLKKLYLFANYVGTYTFSL